jgi:hypothetical protein
MNSKKRELGQSRNKRLLKSSQRNKILKNAATGGPRRVTSCLAPSCYSCVYSMHNSRSQGLHSIGGSRLFILVFLALLALAGCSQSGGKQEYSYVTAPEAVLRDRVATVYTKTGVLHNGERVVVLERMTNRRFARVRSPHGEEGWIQERYLTDQPTFDQFQRLQEEFKNAPAQAVAEARTQVNLHITPGRKTEHLYQLNEKEKVDLLQRQTADKNAQPATGAQAKDGKEPETETAASDEQAPAKPGTAPILEDWWLVRDAQKRVGWVLGQMLYVDVPTDVGEYAEGHRVVGFYMLDQVQDENKTVPEYLLALSENKDGMPYDFDQVRVFTWNARKHRYETAFRDSSLDGFLPVTVGREDFDKEGNLPTFTLRLADSNGSIHQQKYKFVRPIVRQVLAPGEQPVPKVHHKTAKKSK